MDKMILSKIGKLKITCSLPLFSDSICIKKQSAAEHGYTQILLSIVLAPHLKLSQTEECELIELAIFAELPKVFLGDPSFYLRQRHPEVKEVYRRVRERIRKETEESLEVKTTRSPELWALHELIDSFAAKLFIEKECLLGNQFFMPQRNKTFYDEKRAKILAGNAPQQKAAVALLDELFDEANVARIEGGIAEYSATFLGMMEKLKEHFRYKGWNYHYPESVGEHTFQVTFLASLVASQIHLPEEKRIALYRMAALHDLAEAYATDVIYPIKVREKEMGELHHKIEDEIIKSICQRFHLTLPDDEFYYAVVKICDCFSAQIYFDRERRSGNSLFDTSNESMEKTREKYQDMYPEILEIIDRLWLEYLSAF